MPRESIICPFTPPLAYATQAVINGVDLRLNAPVQAIERTPDGDYLLHCPQETFACRYLVNAAGLHSDTINRLLGHDEFGVIPRRGATDRVRQDVAPGWSITSCCPCPAKWAKAC